MAKHKKLKEVLTPEVKHAMRAVLEYSWDAELENAQEQFNENGEIKGHVFESLVVLDNFLSDRTAKPMDYMEPSE